MTLATQTDSGIGAIMEQLVIQGDLKALQPHERVAYYQRVCESLGLNPLTTPLQYIQLQGKLTLYPTRGATDQLASVHGISVSLGEGRELRGMYLARATAIHQETGRSADATGVVPMDGQRGALTGENLANALMKAETKACRRAVLRLVGLTDLSTDVDMTEMVPGAVTVAVDRETGEIQQPAQSNVLPDVDWAAFSKALQAEGIDKGTLAAKVGGTAGKNAILKYCRRQEGAYSVWDLIRDLVADKNAQITQELDDLEKPAVEPTQAAPDKPAIPTNPPQGNTPVWACPKHPHMTLGPDGGCEVCQGEIAPHHEATVDAYASHTLTAEEQADREAAMDDAGGNSAEDAPQQEPLDW